MYMAAFGDFNGLFFKPFLPPPAHFTNKSVDYQVILTPMKKSTFLLTMLLCGLSAFSQVTKPVKIDSTVTVSLPKDYTKLDTLGQQIFSGRTVFGYVQVVRAANPPGRPLKREKDLNKVLLGYENKLLASAKRSNVINDHDTTVNNNLIARDFVLQVDTGSGIQDRQFRVVYTKDYTYTFQFLYNDVQKEVVAKELKDFFSSIKFAPDLNRDDQYTLIGQFTGMHKALKLGLIIGGIVLILLFILLVRVLRKKRPVN